MVHIHKLYNSFRYQHNRGEVKDWVKKTKIYFAQLKKQHMPNIVEVAEELIWRLNPVLFPLEALWNSIYLLMDILFFGVSVLRRR